MKQLLNRLLRRNSFPQHKHEIKEVFTCNGTVYYQYADFNNIPALRGLKTMVYFEEMKMKCTVDYLKQHYEATKNLLRNRGKIDVFEINKLNEQLGQRLDMALDMEIVYKLASVVYFDKNEDTSDYDFAYNRKKIENFRKAGTDFFLLMPLQELAPALKAIDENLNSYFQVNQDLNNLHLETLSRHLHPVKKAI